MVLGRRTGGQVNVTHSDERLGVVFLLVSDTEGFDLCLEVAVPRVTGEDQLHKRQTHQNE